MGTNFYARYNACDCCGRYDSLHIGKNFKAVRVYLLDDPDQIKIESFQDWRAFLSQPGVTVWNEYGRLIPPVDLSAWLSAWTNYDDNEDWDTRDQYASQYRSHGAFLDPDGYHCTPDEFS